MERSETGGKPPHGHPGRLWRRVGGMMAQPLPFSLRCDGRLNPYRPERPVPEKSLICSTWRTPRWIRAQMPKETVILGEACAGIQRESSLRESQPAEGTPANWRSSWRIVFCGGHATCHRGGLRGVFPPRKKKQHEQRGRTGADHNPHSFLPAPLGLRR